MSFQKGHPKKGGREKGTPNELTKELREMVSTFLTDNWSLIESDFQKLQPKDRLMFYERLLSYSLPKLNSFDLSTGGEKVTTATTIILPTGREIKA